MMPVKRVARLWLFAVVLVSATGASELEVRFEGGDWIRPAGVEAITPEVAAGGVCFTAPAALPLIQLIEAGVPQELVTFPVRFALAGQEGAGARLDPLVPGKDRATNVLLVVFDGAELTVAGVPVAEVETPTNLPPQVAWMDADLNGLGEVLNLVKAEVRLTESRGEVPRAVLIGRSGTSFGLVVRTLQLLSTQGCRSGVVKVDDAFPDLSFEVSPDPGVAPPVGDAAAAPAAARIVVNVLEDGTTEAADGSVIVDDAALVAHLNAEKVMVEALGEEPVLFLRGDKQAVFKHCRRVIRIGAGVGVDRVIFATYARDEATPETTEAPTVGERVDRAIEATRHGLGVAKESTKEGLGTAAEKTEKGVRNSVEATGGFLKKVGEKLEEAAEDVDR